MPLQDTDNLVIARSGTNYRMPATELKTYSGGLAVVGPTAPSSPDTGRLWYNTTSGRLSVYDGSAWVDASPAAPTGTSIPAGTVVYAAGSTTPTGWLKANGALISRSTYSDLFTAIGTTFGVGDGSTTFALPDLRGEFIRGWADGRAPGWSESDRVFGSFQDQAFLSHNHGVNDPSHAHGVFDPGHVHNFGYEVPTRANNDIDTQGSNGIRFALNSSAVPNTAISGTGIGIFGQFTGITIQGNGGNETRSRNIALLAIIKY